MKILILVAHPNKRSFNHALATTCAKTLRQKGHKVIFHDLYAERFDPLLTTNELSNKAVLPPYIRKHCKELAEVEGIVIVHPNWWGQPPAILKGWIDRVIRQGVAYKFVAGDDGEGVPVGLLKIKKAVVLTTSNTEAKREKQAFGDPLDGLWKRCIFGLCGIKNVTRKNYGVVIVSTLKQRKLWLRDASRIVCAKFKN